MATLAGDNYYPPNLTSWRSFYETDTFVLSTRMVDNTFSSAAAAAIAKPLSFDGCQCCFVTVPSDPTIPNSCPCAAFRLKSVVVKAGKHSGHLGVVVDRIGTKMLLVRLNPMLVKVHESSVIYFESPDLESSLVDSASPAKVQTSTYNSKTYTDLEENDQSNPPDVVESFLEDWHTPRTILATPTATSRPRDHVSPTISNESVMNASLEIGKTVVISGGTHRGKLGVVQIVHPKMVTIKLSDRDKIVRVWQHNVKLRFHV